MSDDTIEVTSVTTTLTTTVIVSQTTLHVPARLSPGAFAVARRALVALIDAREFLGYQLSHANGGIDDETLEEFATRYLRHELWDAAKLEEAVEELASLIPDRLDADVVATVFACDVDLASRVLVRAATTAASNALASTAVATLASGDG